MQSETGRTKAERLRRAALASWVAAYVMPCERKVRVWLLRRTTPEDVDEIVQDAYCRLARLDDVSHIDRPDAYFFSIARNLLVRRLRRQQIIPFEVIAEVDAFLDDQPSPEKQVADKRDYARLMALMADLPERCRRIVQLRKIENWSQKQIADHMGTTEKAVEKQIWLGVNAIRAAWSVADDAADERFRDLLTDRKVQR